ncbi:4-hydroxy-tetrahydrodipicolinate reductase [Porphyromonadaceae bacterium W3.11]|nr:4-hydroxy-tetrahydrodipicolinate reductase [Porphyromonadaceae bacterium W3.11]
MKICIIGYGKMGHEVERIALSRGHEVVGKLDAQWDTLPECDVAIEFTTPETAFENISKAIKQGVPIVSGTTGWLKKYDDILTEVDRHEGSFFYASNFSIGIYLFRQLNKHLAKMMNFFPEYDASMEEIHHIHKLDYPSGTALTLADEVIEQLAVKTESKPYLATDAKPDATPEQLLIRSVREGEVPGTHTIRYESEEDVIEIKHEAKGRAGLARGAVLAAEFIQGKKGVFGMEDLVNIK